MPAVIGGQPRSLPLHYQPCELPLDRPQNCGSWSIVPGLATRMHSGGFRTSTGVCNSTRFPCPWIPSECDPPELVVITVSQNRGRTRSCPEPWTSVSLVRVPTTVIGRGDGKLPAVGFSLTTMAFGPGGMCAQESPPVDDSPQVFDWRNPELSEFCVPRVDAYGPTSAFALLPTEEDQALQQLRIRCRTVAHPCVGRARALARRRHAATDRPGG